MRLDPAMHRFQGLLAYAAASLAVATVVLLLTPLHLFLADPALYGTSPGFVLGGLVGPWLAVLAVALLVGLLLPPRVRRAATLTLSGLAFGAVLSGLAFAGIAGALGVVVRLTALLLPPAILLVLRRRIGRAAPAVAAAALVVGTLLALWPMLRPGDWRPAPPADPLSYFGLHRLSGDGDVIHLVFDRLGTPTAESLLLGDEDVAAGDEELAEDLDGFTLYTDHAGDVLAPRQALRSLLTGEPSAAADGAWSEPTVARLRAGGVSTLVLGAVDEICAGGDFGDCVTSPELLAEVARPRLRLGHLGAPLVVDPLHARLVDGALWSILGWSDRDAPFLAQPILGLLAGDGERDGDADATALAQAADAFERYVGSLYVGPGERRYLLFRFPGGGERPTLGADCALAGDAEASDAAPPSAESEASCLLGLVATLADELQAIGVYDRTAIVVQATLGRGAVAADALPQEWRDFTTEVDDRPASELAAEARPLLLVKLPDAEGDLEAVRRPTAPRHTAASLLALFDLAAGDDLPAPFWQLEADPPDAAARPLWVVAEGSRGYEEIVVEGPVADLGSWRHVGVFEAPGQPAVSLPAVEDVRFNVRQEAAPEGGRQVVVDFWTTTETQAEYAVSTLGADGAEQVVQPYSPTRTLTLAADRVGCGLQILIRGRSVGSSSPAEAQATLVLGPDLGDCAQAAR